MARLPSWVWLYKHKVHQLRALHNKLKKQSPCPIFKNTSEEIEIHPMNFLTGETDPSMFEHFSPDADSELEIANTSIDPNSPVDDGFCRMREQKKRNPYFDSSTMDPQLYKSFANYISKSPLGNRAPMPWEMAEMTDSGSLFNSNDLHGFTVEKGATRIEARSGHQVVIMKSSSLQDETAPSAGELLVLVKWMLSGYQPQVRHLSKSSRAKTNASYVLDFPTMVISFLPMSRVRILYGYFDQDRLKVAYTQAVDFDTDEYADNMDVLLAWVWPQANADNTKPVPLPTIEESEEDEAEEESEGKADAEDDSDDWDDD